MSSSDIAEFLHARLDEDEAAAKALGAADLTSQVMTVTCAVDVYTNRFGPARVLREVEAKRAIIPAHGPQGAMCCKTCEPDGDEPYSSRGLYPCYTLRQLAAVYSDHPDYRQEWKP